MTGSGYKVDLGDVLNHVEPPLSFSAWARSDGTDSRVSVGEWASNKYAGINWNFSPSRVQIRFGNGGPRTAAGRRSFNAPHRAPRRGRRRHVRSQSS